jgi:hypothetical protein
MSAALSMLGTSSNSGMTSMVSGELADPLGDGHVAARSTRVLAAYDVVGVVAVDAVDALHDVVIGRMTSKMGATSRS